jgi:glycine/D-amino acid oxidase-like deaminating enzyme
VRVHEARRVAWGASGRNGGFALRGGALPYHEARHQLGRAGAGELWRLTERYLDRMAELAGDALRRVGSLRLTDGEELDEIRAEYEALLEAGFSAEWLERLDPPLDRLFRAAIRHPTDGTLHPARWVRRLAARAVEAGAEIIEESRVESLDEVDADHVVIATDGYTQGLLPELDGVIRPVRGQVIVTEPLERILYPCPHYARHGFDYWQQTPEGNLVLGGRRDVSLETENTGEEAITDAVQGALEAFAEELIGEPPRVTHRWSGIFGATDDRLPLAGPVPGREGTWVAAGYSGHGNVLGLACGELVAEAILGRPPPELELFDPARLL